MTDSSRAAMTIWSEGGSSHLEIVSAADMTCMTLRAAAAAVMGARGARSLTTFPSSSQQSRAVRDTIRAQLALPEQPNRAPRPSPNHDGVAATIEERRRWHTDSFTTEGVAVHLQNILV